MLLTGGVVWTGDPARAWAEAVRIQDGRIVEMGSARDLAAAAPAGETTVALDGAFVAPGLVDAHAHVLGLGYALERIDLVGAATLEETLARVGGRAAEKAGREESGWLLGRGWDQNDWPEPVFPDRRVLDAVALGYPAALTRIDGHALWANSEALRVAGIDRDTPDPPGGKIHRDANGEPTGILIDNAMDLLAAAIPEPDETEKRRAVERALAAMVEVGLTGVHDMGMSADDLRVYRAMAAEGPAAARVYAAYSATDPALDAVLAGGPDAAEAGGWFRLAMVKFYLDGALGSRGAALLAPYSDDPENRGLVLMERDAFAARLRRVVDAGFQAAVHAIGDRANRTALDTWSELLAADPSVRDRLAVDPGPPTLLGTVPPARPALRLEHAQILDPADIPRLGADGVLASMQPTHCTSDMPWAPRRLGEHRLAGAYAWRSVIAGGAVLASGSDFPVESHDPRHGLYAAVARRGLDGEPAGGWSPEQRLGREEALLSFTVAPAYASGDLARRGTITPGKDADLVVFDTNLVTCDAEAILEARVLLTLTGGRVVWAAPDGPFAGFREDGR